MGVCFIGMVSGIGVKESGNEPKKAGWECYAVCSSRLLRKKRHNSVSDGRTRTALLGSDAMVGNEKFEHDTLYQQGREQIEIAYLQAMHSVDKMAAHSRMISTAAAPGFWSPKNSTDHKLLSTSWIANKLSGSLATANPACRHTSQAATAIIR